MTDHRAEAEALLAATVNPELVERAAKALHADVCCPADGRDGACVYPNDLWGDRHVARTVLDAVADDIRAGALADLAAAHPVPALTRAMNHARRAEDHWAADTVASLVDALTRCTRPHPTARVIRAAVAHVTGETL